MTTIEKIEYLAKLRELVGTAEKEAGLVGVDSRHIQVQPKEFRAFVTEAGVTPTVKCVSGDYIHLKAIINGTDFFALFGGKD